MKVYDVSYKKLSLLLLPTFLRNPVMIALITACVTPIANLHARLIAYRDIKTYRLTHDGQVCYLRAVLNDKFDPEKRRITITDNTDKDVGLTIHARRIEELIIPQGDGFIINRRGFGGVNGYDFIVNIPVDGNINEQELRALVNIYKLASIRYTINYITYG